MQTLWQGCDEEAERLQHYVKKHGKEHPEITCVECKATFFIKLTNLRNTLKSVGTKLQTFNVTSAGRHIGTSTG